MLLLYTADMAMNAELGRCPPSKDYQMTPTEFEIEAIRFILEHEEPDLLMNLPQIDVAFRSHNGSGYYVNFTCRDVASARTAGKRTLGKSVYGEVAGMKLGVGFMLFVDKGMISTLEIFSHGGEDIPASVTQFELSSG